MQELKLQLLFSPISLRLLTAIKLAAKVVNREINKAGLTDILGSALKMNVQGETQQKLDLFANMHFKQVCCCGGNTTVG